MPATRLGNARALDKAAQVRRQLQAVLRRKRPLRLHVQVRRFRRSQGAAAAVAVATWECWGDQRRWATPPHFCHAGR